MTRFWAVSITLYLLLMAALTWGLVRARRGAEQTFSSGQSQRAWEDWRRKVSEERDRPKTVERSVPKSSEPPTLVLLRDHFWVSLAGAVSITSALYWTIAFFLRGTLSGPSFPIDLATENDPRRGA